MGDQGANAKASRRPSTRRSKLWSQLEALQATIPRLEGVKEIVGPQFCMESGFLQHLPLRALVMVYLPILAVIVAILGVTIDVVITFSYKARVAILGVFSFSTPLQLLFYCAYTVLLTCVAFAITRVLGPAASGSGIPEMKCMLSGVWLPQYLRFNVFLAKLLGTVTAIGGGLVVGKEGPLVHLAALVNEQLTKRLGIFVKLRKNPAIRQSLMMAACSIGVAANFDSPIGGVLFSTEVTSAYFALHNQYFSFVASFASALVFTAIYNTFRGEKFDRSYLLGVFDGPAVPDQGFSLFIAVVCGVVGGLLGALYVHANTQIAKFRRTTKIIFYQPLAYTITVALLTAIGLFPGSVLGPMAAWTNSEILTNLFNDDLSNKALLGSIKPGTVGGVDDYTTVPTFYNLRLLGLFVIRFLLQCLTTSLPIPLGISFPTLASGAIIGWLIGAIFSFFVPDGIMPSPSVCAALGSAGLSSGVSHTLSTAVLLVELTQKASLMFPLVLSCLISVGISSQLGPSIFDCLMKTRKLPFLPPLNLTQYVVKTQDIMKPTVYLSYNSSRQDIVDAISLLSEFEKATDYYDGLEIPLVDAKESRLLVGQLDINQLRKILALLDEGKAKEADIPQLFKQTAESSFQPFYFPPDLNFEHAHSCFTTMSLTKAYVINNGQLLGVVTRGQMLHGLAEPKRTRRARAISHLPSTPFLNNASARSVTRHSVSVPVGSLPVSDGFDNNDEDSDVEDDSEEDSEEGKEFELVQNNL